MSSHHPLPPSRFTSPRPHSPTSLPRSAAAATLLAGSLLALAGCATPQLQPTLAVPEHFVSAADGAAEAAGERWWRHYGDPVLERLIERAARENRDLRIAAERVRAARAGTTITRSWLLPSVGLSGSTALANNDYPGAAQQAVPETDRRAAGLEVSWEIDLSGRLRAGAEAAAADAEAAASEARGLRLLVVADVASNYFTLVGALRQRDTLRALADAQDETLRLVSARQRAGLASPFDVERARTEADRARAAIPPLETLVAQSRHRLAVLTGGQPAEAAAIEPWSGTLSPPQVAAGQPAALLARRPDLQVLQARLVAANWRRQEAAAEWFPRLFTSALFGSQDIDVNGGGLGSARFGNVAGLLTMPLVTWGRTQAINEVADAAQQEALLRYEDGIVRALEDVENALVALRDEGQRASYLRSAAASANAALGRAQSLYRHGQIDLLPLLDAQRAQLQVQLGANDSETALLLDSVRLFKALGGGWLAFEPAAPAVSQAPRPLPVATTENPS
jgi:outer membrane protein, multidrug efflux system